MPSDEKRYFITRAGVVMLTVLIVAVLLTGWFLLSHRVHRSCNLDDPGRNIYTVVVVVPLPQSETC